MLTGSNFNNEVSTVSQFDAKQTDKPMTPKGVGANDYGNTPLSPDQMASVYQEIDRKHILRQQRQQAKTEPDPNTAGAFEGKIGITDPKLS